MLIFFLSNIHSIFHSNFSETYPHGFVGKRNLNHRISSISHVSDSSVDSDEGILRHKLNSSVIDIERTDSGVGSETSKSSKASVLFWSLDQQTK